MIIMDYNMNAMNGNEACRIVNTFNIKIKNLIKDFKY